MLKLLPHAANTSEFTESIVQYNTNGSVLAITDAMEHQSKFSYTDSFSDSGNQNSFAYPTTITEGATVTGGGGFASYLQYNYDFGAKTRIEGPPPASPSQGLIQTLAYDSAARLERITTANNSAYTRYTYGPNYLDSYSTVNSVADEARSVQTFDGVGRLIGAATIHPGSSYGYSTRTTIYDQMGRAIRQSNPAETNGSWAPAGDDDAGWLYTQQTYDWNGRPRITTNPDLAGTTKEASYSGCGCAGGEVVTLTDEVGRRQKVYSDVLGRTARTEALNWDSSIYATTTSTYDARDQVTQVRQYAGAEGSPAFQDTTMTYDGYGRLKTKHAPEQNAGTTTVWDYNSDDTTQKITDARGASQTLSYNSRHLVTGITYAVPGGSGITVPAAASFAYDAAGNRTSMTDGFGSMSYSYDQLSRLTSETRYFSALWNSPTSGNYGIGYQYNLANELTSITDPFGAQIGYTRDTAGRTTAVTGSSFAGVTQYVSAVQYRAWGAVKAASYGNASYSANWSSTTQYNGRLQPKEFRLTDNIYATSLMSENYTYGGDRRLASLTDLNDTAGSNPPVTLRFLSRSFGYDQAGRVSQVYSPHTAPLYQTYDYDEFGNMKGRSGSYYWQPSQSDAGSFSNNRRNSWSYSADGQVTANPASVTDNAHTFNYDAANRLTNSNETIGSGTSSYSPAYDGDGKVVYESQVTTGTLASSSSSYTVRATVLGSQILTRLDQNGNKLVTYVPAEGLLFVTQNVSPNGNWVGWTQRDPVGISETGKGIYDPLGNYIPFQQHDDPRPPVGSYNSSSMGGFYAGFASNPFQLNIGCI